MAIFIYFGAAIEGTTHSNLDITFTQYLKKLVDKNTGLVGRYSGWGVRGSLYLNAAIFEARGSQSQPNKSAGDESEGDESEGDESEGDESEGDESEGDDTEEVEEDDDEEEEGDDDEEDDETPPPPPPTKALERVKQVGKAAQPTSSKVQLRSQMVKQVADPKGKQRATPSAAPKASSPLRSEDDEGDEDDEDDKSEDHGEEEEEDETSLPPPPTKVLESMVRQVGKATPLPPHTAQLRF